VTRTANAGPAPHRARPGVRRLAGLRAALVPIVAAVVLLGAGAAHAEGRLFKVPTRPDVATTLYWEARDGAKATVLLFPGGAGGFGKIDNGKPSGQNFLVRSTQHFLDNGFNVAIFGRPDDTPDLENAGRVSERHMSDVRAVLEFVQSKSALPVWIVGTSRGTVSAAATAINVRNPGIAGLVLTSSIVTRKIPGNVPGQNLPAIRVPVLVLHHAKDACFACRPYEAPAILDGLVNAPVKKLILADGGADPGGDPCGPLHWHGFIGMEKQAVDTIAGWIGSPTTDAR
jgi:hypothetical protein